MALVFLLILVGRATASYRLSEKEECPSELSKLKQNVRSLEGKLMIGEWRLIQLRAHRRFRLIAKPQPPPVHNVTVDSEGGDHKSVSIPGTGGSLLVYDKDCSQIYDRLRPASGFYRIKPKSSLEPFLVYCDMEDGGGWTVIQKRRNGRVDFNREWTEYKEGFGNFKLRNDEYWLGNEHIHSLLSEGDYLLRIDLMDWSGENKHAMYDSFRLLDEKDKYRLYFGLYSGQAGDSLNGGGGMIEQWSASHNGMQFSTRDQDHDRYLQGSCASENNGGWWYNRCHAANLNGRYYRGGDYKSQHDNGVVWSTWRGLWYSLRHTTMKVKPWLSLDSLGSGAGPDE